MNVLQSLKFAAARTEESPDFDVICRKLVFSSKKRLCISAVAFEPDSVRVFKRTAAVLKVARQDKVASSECERIRGPNEVAGVGRLWFERNNCISRQIEQE
jgi:hypothetical protein